eukprot:GEMP01053688.1.p1 GENE.GEMP01053688.1~~GEMP01053688.1.p1  ORF type:complete len:416 (+),score=101.36 GEMP01053688.1:302-1549(+)
MSILALISDGDEFERQRTLHKLQTLDAKAIENLCLSTKRAGDTFDASLLLAAFQVLAQVWRQIPRLYRVDIVHLLADRLKVAGDEELCAARRLQGIIMRKENDSMIRSVVTMDAGTVKEARPSAYTPAQRQVLLAMCQKNPAAVTWAFPTDHSTLWRCALMLNRPVEIPSDPYMRYQVGAYACAEAKFDLASDAWRDLWQKAHSRRVYCYLHALETMAGALTKVDITLVEDAARWAHEGGFVLLEEFLDAVFELWSLRLSSQLARNAPGTLAESRRQMVPALLQHIRNRFHAMSTSASPAWRKWTMCQLEEEMLPIPLGVFTRPDGARLKFEATAQSVDGGTLLCIRIDLRSSNDPRWSATEAHIVGPSNAAETHVLECGVDTVLVALAGTLSIRVTMLHNRLPFGFPTTVVVES